MSPYPLSYDENGVSIRQIVRLCGESKGMVETISNWNSESKLATEIKVHIYMGENKGYHYKAVVDDDLMFKEMDYGICGPLSNSNTGFLMWS